jgi:hypothetical protein
MDHAQVSGRFAPERVARSGQFTNGCVTDSELIEKRFPLRRCKSRRADGWSVIVLPGESARLLDQWQMPVLLL